MKIKYQYHKHEKKIGYTFKINYQVNHQNTINDNQSKQAISKSTND